jgi:hypothetical protein
LEPASPKIPQQFARPILPYLCLHRIPKFQIPILEIWISAESGFFGLENIQ